MKTLGRPSLALAAFGLLSPALFAQAGGARTSAPEFVAVRPISAPSPYAVRQVAAGPEDVAVLQPAPEDLASAPAVPLASGVLTLRGAPEASAPAPGGSGFAAPAGETLAPGPVAPTLPATVPAAPAKPATQGTVVAQTTPTATYPVAEAAPVPPVPAVVGRPVPVEGGAEHLLAGLPVHEAHEGAAGREDRIRAFVDMLYLKARGADLIYGQPRDGLSTISAPLGAQGILEPDYAGGVRAGVEYCLSACAGIDAEVAWWQNQTHSFLGLPPGAPPGSVIQSTVTLPSVMNAAGDSLTATGALGLEFRTADLVYRHLLCGESGRYSINWLAGARYAELRQDYSGVFTILGTTDVDTSIKFEGIGPRAGLDGELLCGHGVRLYGRTTANFLAGHFGGSYNQFNVFAGEQGNIDYKNDRIVPILELELGVGWVSPKGHVRVMAGYYLAAWFDTVVTPDFIAGVRANNFSTSGGNLQSDLTFDGLMGRVEFVY